MKVLVINCGSSSLKYQLIDMTTEESLAQGLVERIGIEGSVLTQKVEGRDKYIVKQPMADHKDAIKLVLEALVDEKNGVISSMDEISAVGHRVVHGGEKYNKSVIIDAEVKSYIEECFKLATKAFENGDEPKRACFALGHLYLKGIGTDVNPLKALEFLSVPLSICDDNQGIASLFYDEAKDMIDMPTFVNWLKSTCNRFPYSQYRLGEMYKNGEYFVADELLAEEYYSKSASGGCVDGIMSLAILLKDSGIQSKELRAEKLFKDIIASKYTYEHRRAKRCLATLYQHTNKLTEALNICDEILAEDPRDTVVYNIKGSVYLEKKDYRQARQWFEKSYSISNDQKCKDLIDSIDEVIRTGADKQTSSGGGCYVATAIYGSYDCPQVWTLRRFRDNTLDSTWYGKLFIWLYYSISPTIVKYFGNTKLFKAILKNKLDKFVRKLNEEGVENTPYIDKIF